MRKLSSFLIVNNIGKLGKDVIMQFLREDCKNVCAHIAGFMVHIKAEILLTLTSSTKLKRFMITASFIVPYKRTNKGYEAIAVFL